MPSSPTWPPRRSREIPPRAPPNSWPIRETIRRALEQLRATPEGELFDARRVGRAGLPSTVIGLLFHAAEHSTRHAGQLLTTAKVVRGLGEAGGEPSSER